MGKPHLSRLKMAFENCGLARLGVNIQNIVPVGDYPRHPINRGLIGDITGKRNIPNRGFRGVQVVLADKNYRQFMDRRQIHRFVKDALI